MDKFYPAGAAAAKLDEITTKVKEALKARGTLNIQHLANAELGDVVVRESASATKSWVMCTPEIEDGTVDEVVFRLQGVLMRNDLVPKGIQHCPDRKFKNITQYVQICGVQSDTFEESMAKVSLIHKKFAQHLSIAQFSPHVEAQGAVGTLFAASNRLFTSKRDAPTEQDNKFEYGLDPVGIIGRRKTEDLIHAPANIVKYFRLQTSGDEKKYKYIETVPGIFSTGDIVELQISFVAIMSAYKKIKVTNRLQAITLLSDEFTKEAADIRASAISKPQSVAFRRKVGYFYEDEEEARAFKRLATEDE